MRLKIRREVWGVILVFALFVLIRSIHFSEYLNFSADQGDFSSRALQIYQTKQFPLIGPPFSFNLSGRYIYQGPFIYYLQLLFLLLGGFDPIKASFAFMVFAAIGIFPLYFGIKKLINERCAYLMILIYALLPYFINYTRFLWNPNYQLALMPYLIYFMGKFKEKVSRINFLIISILLGISLQFHYQFFIIILGLFLYYFLIKKTGWIYLLLFLAGIILGFLPLIIFDFRNNFYNFNTLILFGENWERVLAQNPQGESFVPHYYLSLSLFLILISLNYFKKVPEKFIYVFAGGLIILDLFLYLPKPSHGFGMSEGWDYLDEQKVNQIILAQGKSDFNVANLGYDTLAHVQKYLLLKEGIKGEFEDYINNEYLFVIANNDDYMKNAAYEVSTFKPSSREKEWVINEKFKLYLLKRVI